MKTKKAAMEMSVGTIVTIVLLMSVLILGIFLIKNIFSSAKGAIDLTNDQLQNEINQLFGDEDEFVIYPKTGLVEVRQGELESVGIGIQNLLEGEAGANTFSYETIVSSTGKCVEDKEEIATWLEVGQSEENIAIRVGDTFTEEIRFKVPVGSSLCTPRFRINVYAGEKPYATGSFDIEIKAAKR